MNKKLEEEICKHGEKRIIKQHTRQNPIFVVVETQTSRKMPEEESVVVTLQFRGTESRLAEEHVVKGEGWRHIWCIV